MPYTMNAREPTRAVTNTSSIGRKDLTSFLPSLRREDISVIESGKSGHLINLTQLFLNHCSFPGGLIIVFRRVDVNKKLFGMVETLEFGKGQPPTLHGSQQVNRPSFPGLDQRCRAAQTGINTIERA